MKYKHIIFGFDGVLFDTFLHTARAFQIMLKREYGVNENVADIERYMRQSTQTALDFYKEKYELSDSFYDEFKKFQVLYENQRLLPRINAHEICKYVYNNGGCNYLCTERDNSVVSLMQKHGFYELFREIVTSESPITATDKRSYLVDKYNMQKDETLYIDDLDKLHNILKEDEY